MSNSRQTAVPDVLVAETKDVRPFARLLRGIGLKHHAVMTVSRAGFEVTVEEVRTLCELTIAIAWIPTNLFDVFTFKPPPNPQTGITHEQDEEDDPEPECFEISLDALLQCLNIFGNAGPSAGGVTSIGAGSRSKRRWAGEGDPAAGGGPGGDDDEDWRAGGGGGGGAGSKRGRTGMRMSWKGPGHELEVLLKDDNRGPTTRCSLKTMEPEELMNQAFDESQTALYLIMKSEWFRDALLDLPPTCSKIMLTATPRNSDQVPPIPDATGSSNNRRTHRANVGNFSIQATGDFGTAQLDYPNDKELMDKFDCAALVCHNYHSSHFALLTRALQQSIKIAVQIEHSGFLCVQIMMPVAEGVPLGDHSGILEFKMHALEDDDLAE